MRQLSLLLLATTLSTVVSAAAPGQAWAVRLSTMQQRVARTRVLRRVEYPPAPRPIDIGPQQRGGRLSRFLRGAWERDLIPTRWPIRIAAQLLRGLAYPAALSGEALWRGGRGLWRAAREWRLPRLELSWSGVRKRLWREIPAALVFAATVGFISTSSQSFQQFDNRTGQITPAPAPPGSPAERRAPTVLVQGFEPGSTLARQVHLRYQLLQRQQPDAILLEPKDEWEMVALVKAVARDHGRIERLDIFGHGVPGMMRIREALISHPVLTPPAQIHHAGIDEGDFDPRAASGNRPLRLRGVMAPGACIRLFSCQAAYGAPGQGLLSEFGQVFFDQGGTVHGSQVDLQTDLLDHYSLRAAHPPDLRAVHTVVRYSVPGIYLLDSVLPSSSEPDHLTNLRFSGAPVRTVHIESR